MDNVIKFRVKKSDRANAKHINNTRVFTDNAVNDAIMYDIVEILAGARKFNKMGVFFEYEYNGSYYLSGYYLQLTCYYSPDFIVSIYRDIKNRYQTILDKQFDCFLSYAQLMHLVSIVNK